MAAFQFYKRRSKPAAMAMEQAATEGTVDLDLNLSLGSHREEEDIGYSNMKEEIGDLNVSTKQEHGSDEVIIGSCLEKNLVVDGSIFSIVIDLNEPPVYNNLEDVEVPKEESTPSADNVVEGFDISEELDNVIEGLDISEELEVKNGSMGFSDELEVKNGSMGFSDELEAKNGSMGFSGETPQSISGGGAATTATLKELNSNPKFQDDGIIREQPKQKEKPPQNKATQKPRKKKHRPKVAVDAPKPVTPKQTKEKKPISQTREQKPKLAKRSKKPRLSESDDDENGAESTVSDSKPATQPVARALDFHQSESSDLDSRRRSRSKRRRRLNLFTLIIRRRRLKKVRKERLLFTIRWGRRRRRSHKLMDELGCDKKDLEMEISRMEMEMETLRLTTNEEEVLAKVLDLERTTKLKGSKRKRVGRKKGIDSDSNTALIPYQGLGAEDACRKRKRVGRKKVIDPNSALVPYQGAGPLALLKKGKTPKVDLDSETLRVWNLLMNVENRPSEGEENVEWWKKEREVFFGRVSSFNARMYQIQGDRGFRKWKGSVLDSVVGVFLTQNVSDHLSSNAFMSLVSNFPLAKPISSSENSACDEILSQGSVGSNPYFVIDAEPELENSKEPTDISIGVFPWKSDGKGGENEENKAATGDSSSIDSDKKNKSSPRGKGKKKKKKKNADFDWDSLRIQYSDSGPRSEDHMDLVDWEAVRLVGVDELAIVIKERGQHNVIARKIQKFLNRVVDLHKSLDLEWLRNVPPDLVKEYLLEVDGLGLKSVECIRLLCLNTVAFPVDTNVGRIAVRLGWVPLRPLPEELQIHLLEQYPMMDSIQKYLWPRLCTLDQKTLYELHYQMITFGKVFCTKRNPNCNACPMRSDCRHFASAFASSKLALPGPSGNMGVNLTILDGQVEAFNAPPLKVIVQKKICEPIIEEPIELSPPQPEICEPSIEEPIELSSPVLETPQSAEEDIRRLGEEDDMIDYDFERIPIIKLNMESFKSSLHHFMTNNDDENSNALVVLNSYAASIPRPKLKYVSRLRTEHQVYELPQNHVLLQQYGLEQTKSNDEVQYHLAIWRPGETIDSLEPPTESCNSTGSEVCNDETCYSCNNTREVNSNEVRGTFLIPCRVAMRNGFPLNGTYYQVNEVFVDHETSYEPARIDRDLIWNLRTRTAYFGSSISTILKGASTEVIQKCFWKGVICVRGFERKTRAPRPLGRRFHCLIGKVDKEKKNDLIGMPKDGEGKLL